MSELTHYGMPRRSGRYPWGSGENPYQSAIGFRGTIQELKKQGLSEVEIARGLGIKTTELRARITLAKEEIRAADVAMALRLQQKGLSNVAIGQRMGINESSVRSLLDPAKAERAAITRATSNMLKESVSKFRYIDVGGGAENHVGVSRTKMNTAIAELVEQGYKIHYIKVEQLGIPGQFTSIKVLGSPDSTYSELVNNKDLIQPILGRSEDLGRSYSDLGLKPIKSVSSKDVMIRYGDEGGSDKDGVIELRRGVKDLDLGNSRYAQVRVGIDGTHYLKGMAMYSDDLPDGVNIIFNTNKNKKPGDSKLDVMKTMKDDPDNPFGSTIKLDGQKGSLNIVNEEGDWDKWSKTISSQVMSKQSPALAKQQLNIAFQLQKEEFEGIMRLTNPTVKKQLLEKFADGADSAAVHLKAAALPRQSNKVILPITNMKENEVYAPTYKNGERLVLIRHPHGGPFEIPELIVNNKSKSARAVMENAQDAIGIHPSVAKKMSGADFDGDSVIAIPNDKGSIRTRATIKSLENFDHLQSYAAYPGMPRIKPQTMQTKMGEISNLITDMSIGGANIDEIARAVKHSMVIIDSEKHYLNYKQSYIDHGIASLAQRYQGSARGGAATIISRASSEIRVPERKPRVGVDPVTGQRIYTETGATYIKDGRIVPKTTITTRMAEARWDPNLGGLAIEGRLLSSGTPIERVYENHAAQLKTLANTARKEALSVKTIPYSPSARAAYSQEVATLQSKLNIAQMNRPIERQAQIIANTTVAKKIQTNPVMDRDDLKKVRNQALAAARVRTGAERQKIEIAPREWEAIQSGAVSNNILTQILNNTDLDTIKQYATPRQGDVSLSSAKISRARSMLASGYTRAEVAEALGISVFQLNEELSD